jgi:short-subunit dehydrogenase
VRLCCCRRRVVVADIGLADADARSAALMMLDALFPARKGVGMTVVAGPPLDGGNVLVTGASSGIGRELAVLLAGRARAVVLLARRTALLEQLRDGLVARNPGLEVLVMRVDLSDEREVDRVVSEVRDRIGLVDVLVNNAGVGDQGLFDRSDWERTRRVLLTNVFAVAQLTALLVPSMVERGRGGVLNIGSGAGLTVMPASAAYCASKHFVDGFSEALRARGTARSGSVGGTV